MGVVPQQPFFCDGSDLSVGFKPLLSPRVNDIFPVLKKSPKVTPKEWHKRVDKRGGR